LAYVLAETSNPAGFEVLKTLAADPEPTVRREAVRGFGSLTEKAALERLLTCLQDEDPGVRYVAVSALAMREDSPSNLFAVRDSSAQLTVLASISLYSDEDALAICQRWEGDGASALVRAVASALLGKDVQGLADRPELRRLLSGLARASVPSRR
jgi:HEAT repeat protein